MSAVLTAAQIAALDRIVIDAEIHGMEVGTRDNLMLSDAGHAVHVSYINSDQGLYALVNQHGRHNGLLFYEFDVTCSSYEGEEMCAACTSREEAAS